VCGKSKAESRSRESKVDGSNVIQTDGGKATGVEDLSDIGRRPLRGHASTIAGGMIAKGIGW
jgi:hypothetical protein